MLAFKKGRKITTSLEESEFFKKKGISSLNADNLLALKTGFSIVPDVIS
jgi:hypothetical protein